MKIIHVSFNQFKSGVDPQSWVKEIKFSTGIWESMAKHEETVGFFHAGNRSSFKFNDVQYHFSDYTKAQLHFPFRFIREIKRLNPDVVIVHGLLFPLQVIMLAWKLRHNVKIIAQHHAERPLKGLRYYLQRLADHYIQCYLFCSVDLGKQWVDHGLIAGSEKIKEVMEASAAFLPIDKDIARSVSGISDEFTFLWVGGLHERKDPLLAVRAFVSFHQVNPTARLIMIYQSEELLEQVVSLIAQENASAFIQLKGRIEHDKLLFWYNSVDFIVSSSHYEGSGIAVCEAMSCGCIPVLTNIPSFRMMTDNGSVGVLYEAGDEKGLTEALTYAASLDRKLHKEKVVEQFRNKLSFDAISEQMLNIIRETRLH